jgi:hypothetical protein
MSDTLSAVRYYSGRGWRVIPLNWVTRDGDCSCGKDGCATGKHPWLSQWPVKATTDEAVWGAWWRERPQSQVGIATGEASDLWVLDVDGPPGIATLQRLEDEHGPLPSTWLVRTGSGGLHFYFRWPKNLGQRVFTVDAGVLPGLDYRANGGQVVAPPSRNLKGDYEVVEAVEVAYAPDWLVDMLAKEPPKKVDYVPAVLTGQGLDRRVQSWVQSCCGRVATAPSGTRNKALYAAARAAAEVVAAHGGMTEDQAEGLFCQAAESAGLTAREARVTFRSGWRDGWATPRPLEERPLVKAGGWRRSGGVVPPAPPVPVDDEGGEGDDPGIPHIQVNARTAREVVSDCWDLFLGKRVPELFQQEGRLVRIVDSDWGKIIRAVPSMTLRAMLNQRAAFVKVFDRKDGRVEEHAGAAPSWVPEDMEALPHPKIDHLESVLRAPFVGRDGVVVTEPGYHAGARCWLENHGLRLESMTVAAARAVIDEWLVDFKFAAEHDRTNAVALFLLPFVRRYIRGPTPGHIVEASTPGSGKSLLATILLLPSLGELLKASPFSEVEEERRKGLMSSLIEGRAAILFDNVKGKVDSPSLEGVLTSEVWQDRVLGSTGNIHAVNRAAWVFTSNNAELSLDMARRCIRIRLDQGVERPFDRAASEFVHPDIEGWTRGNRARLVSAALTLIQAWQGDRREVRTLGSFEAWSQVIGGILNVAGYGGWLEGRDEMIRLADRQGDQLRAFVEAWAVKYGDAPRPPHASALVELAESNGLLIGTIGDGSDKSKATRLGAFLGKARGRVFTFESGITWRIAESGRDEKGSTWPLVRVGG